VLHHEQPIGLIQYSRYTDYPEYLEELSTVYPVGEGAVSIDYLIGDPACVGRGIGAAMIVAFTERIWATDPSARCVVVPVASANEASWRALLRAGFRVVAQGWLEPDNPIDDGAHHILRVDRPG
jgi:aminoglycoside 6'-N-acetyltransferase